MSAWEVQDERRVATTANKYRIGDSLPFQSRLIASFKIDPSLWVRMIAC